MKLLLLRMSWVETDESRKEREMAKEKSALMTLLGFRLLGRRTLFLLLLLLPGLSLSSSPPPRPKGIVNGLTGIARKPEHLQQVTFEEWERGGNFIIGPIKRDFF